MTVAEMVARAREAQLAFERDFDQVKTDKVVRAMAKVVYDHAEELARMAVDETRMGVYEDKVVRPEGKEVHGSR